MGCSTCGSGSGNPAGCKSNGGCSSGGCNKKNTYNWLAEYDIAFDTDKTAIVEVSFKQGARKDFFENPIGAITGDWVAVKTDNGFDIGHITLTGELVKLQMKKKRVKDEKFAKILRIATEEDLEKQKRARDKEMDTLIRTRIITKEMGLGMKMGDIEYQADNKKATFYYTADGRVDFRELIRALAKEFKVKIEMRQIGSRQESGRIGGIGACGRELCCSTWLSDFKSVSTGAARYQNLSINQTKLSGQCGRLKCCLNFELDTYMDALKNFPKKVDNLKTKAGTASLIKTDVFKGHMFYAYRKSDNKKIYTLDVERVKEIQALNKAGEFPQGLESYAIITEVEPTAEEKQQEFADVTGQIELKPLKSNKKRRPNRKGGKNRGKSANAQNKGGKQGKKPQGQGKKPQGQGKKPQGQGKGQPRNKPKQGSDAKQGDNKTQQPKSGAQKSNRNNNNRNRNRNKKKNDQNNKPDKGNSDS